MDEIYAQNKRLLADLAKSGKSSASSNTNDAHDDNEDDNELGCIDQLRCHHCKAIVKVHGANYCHNCGCKLGQTWSSTTSDVES